MDSSLDRSHWLRAARLALLHTGPEGVRVEPLARELGVTKGSFYWHFKDRTALLDALFAEWEEETSLLTDAIAAAQRGAPFATIMEAIMEELHGRNLRSERGESPSDAAIFAWAAVDPRIASRANKVESERMKFFRELTGETEMADLFYYAYHGFLLRRRRVPRAAGDFRMIARAALATFTGAAKPGATRTSKARRRITTACIVGAAALLQSCTTYRIIRWRDPAPDAQASIFPQRTVRHADQPFQFVTLPAQRTDLDTVKVRDIDGQMRPFAEYLRNRHIRAFVIVRNDTILYEQYRDGYSASTRSSSFSVAKSLTSALLGSALATGAVRSLDDPLTRYVPALAEKPDYRGVTLRHLLAMQSGFAYSRTNGSFWHDFRSSDAHFYYTTDRLGSLSDMHRENPPGTRWAYKDSDTDLIGWALAEATHRTLAQQFEDVVWRRIGTEYDASWDLDHADGVEDAASGFSATARDFARFGRLYLNNGAWEGQQVLPRDWVVASTTLDRTRTEPEVATWYRMQHQQYWWLPMHNWDAERDFFADGSKGQRIYVHRPTNTIIVQLADDSDQDFPFRRITHYLAGESYEYPKPIPGVLLGAIRRGATADSVRSLFHNLVAREKAKPAELTMTREGMLSLSRMLMNDPSTREMAATIQALTSEHWRR